MKRISSLRFKLWAAEQGLNLDDQQAEALRSDLEQRSGRELLHTDFYPSNHHERFGLKRGDSRNSLERVQDMEFRKSQFKQPEQLPVSEQIARSFEAEAKQARIDALPDAERRAVQYREKADAEARAQSDAAVLAEQRGKIADVLTAAKLNAIRAAFDADLTTREVEFAFHNAALLEHNLDAGQYAKNHTDWARPIAARKSASYEEFRQKLAAETAQRQSQIAEFLPPPAAPASDKPFAWDKPPEVAQSQTKRGMVRIFHDGKATVVPQWAYDDNIDNPAWLAKYATEHGSVDDAVLQDGDSPHGQW
ncbi:hypothetical protein Pan44_35560 [Caulifigura coniformis]|uniref:Uncharacterized protein n=1 Tax=Caulifigura coniformis TaxID=2527983 RepID=A0A517SHC3_9PLAN|nr:hypothetical protein [Caulifigura coniformis]QDT55512.1 hypothetical protein Pan44_35560 [Caulifigura coniformis]